MSELASSCSTQSCLSATSESMPTLKSQFALAVMVEVLARLHAVSVDAGNAAFFEDKAQPY